ncbi:MAG TPA: hypothetical protein VNS22_22980 [Geminicoccus sp.]|uniref:hypothetical protein n=1 Tax=Geminicoccus sp. TaxID=2024832 RepID=UPI002C551056|nr:hypothetical protein [Geminicoccus sp.]HWL71223.1 hypothetical protein [Geminicoccus sp.]
MKRIKLYYSAIRALVIGVLAAGGSAYHQPEAQAQDSSIELSPEDALWLDVKAADTPAAYQSYLEAYPVGRFANQAFRRLVEYSKLGLAALDDDLPGPAAGPGLTGALAAADLY